MTALRRYVLLQIPDACLSALVLAGLYQWAGLAGWLAVGLFGLWVVVNVVQYPFVMHAYSGTPSDMVGPERLIGAPGVVTRTLDPDGWVRVGAELWRADLIEQVGPLPEGSRVQVRAVRGLTLIVRVD
jgi:membrane protein implicated in regulation of membrane protease activity